MSRKKKWVLVAGACGVIAAAAAAVVQYSSDEPGSPTLITDTSAATGAIKRQGDTVGQVNQSNGSVNTANPFSAANGERGQYIVVFREAPLAGYRGTVPGIPAPERYRDQRGTLRLDADGANAQEYVEYLETRQNQMETRMSLAAGRNIEPQLTMQHALNAMVVDLSESEVRSVRGMPEVQLVEAYREYALDTDVGPTLIGAPSVWNGTFFGATAGYRGEGMVIGVIDSGINFGSPSFAAVDPVNGYVHTNPLGAGNYLGTCAPSGVDAGRCNDKLIGGYDFVCSFSSAQQCTATNSREEPGFGDTNGHGTHTASTAAGNYRDALYAGGLRRISGVAPRANIIAYDVCYTEISTGRGLCPNVSTAAAVDQAVADGIVDAINYSIGGGTSPWSDAISLAFLNAVDSGIYVSASAGNSGPGPNTMGHLQPWVSSTANAQHGRAGFSIAMSVTGPAPVPANLAPLLVNQGSGGVVFAATIPGTTPLRISAGIDTASDGCAAYPANTFAGSIAVIRRGTCSFAIKVNNASAAGAVAVVIANNAAGIIIPSVPGTTVPVFSVTQAEGDALRNFGQANPATATAQINFPAIPVPNTADALSASSSRGPAGTFNIMKPDMTAPGTQVLAAVSGTALTGSENAVELFSGTSMASPHQAGAALLIRQARPTWTPAEVKSALAMTANQTVFLEDQVTLANPFGRGSGRVQVDRAIAAGLVLNETRANYLAANPATGGDPATLNQPNLYNRSCFPTCTFFRTFRNTGAVATSWRVQLQGVSGAVTPIITVPGNGSLTVRFSIYGFSLPPNGNFTFGNVVLTPATGNSPVLRLPVGIAVQPPVLSVPTSLSATIATNAVGSTYFTVANTGGSTLTYNFVNSGTAIGTVLDTVDTTQTSGFRSTRYTDTATAGNRGQFASDDFVLAQSTQITRIYVDGFTLVSSTLASVSPTLTWNIYPDAAGVPAGDPVTNPAAALWSYTAGSTSAGVAAVSTATNDSISLDLTAAGQNVTLPAGRYWLVVNANSTLANRWHWLVTSQTTGNAGVAFLTVPTTGTAPWQVVTSSNGLGMRLTGTLSCGAPWIGGTYATSGSLGRGTSQQAMTVAYGTGLAPGSYRANVCVQSNDPASPSLAIPFSLTVTP
jgi:subtilisin family serine protease